MAGEGSRFGYKFKPFLLFNDKLFIQNAVDSFVEHCDKIEELIFVFTREQEDNFNVSGTIEDKINHVFNIRTVILDEKTDSQYETVSKAIQQAGISGRPIIVCDCDHSLQTRNIFKKVKRHSPDCVIPVWKIDINEISSWSIVSISDDLQPIEISEKSLPNTPGQYYGCIGCTYFSNSDYILKYPESSNLSDVVMKLISQPEKQVTYTTIDRAYFFGDPERLEEAKISFTNRDEYDNAKFIRRFTGGSFAQTVLLEKPGGNLIVRKVVKKDKNLDLGYGRLKKQYRDLLRFTKLSEDAAPELLGSRETRSEYYYDMEFLSGYRQLSEYSAEDKCRGMNALLDTMHRDVYSLKATLSDKNDWLEYHLDFKIYEKFKSLSDNRKLSHIINSPLLMIDGEEVVGARHAIDEIRNLHYNFFSPKFLSPAHGDLTFENIMYNGSDVRIIDTDGAEHLDSPLLDFGKMLQSIISQYEKWSSVDYDLVEFGYGNIKLKDSHLIDGADGIKDCCLNAWSDVLGEDREIVEALGYFYMPLHLIRMVPFRMKVSEDQALYAMSTAAKHLNTCLKYVRNM
tara:strand:- start:115 stop:1821 length:1707 start_codon:yes stop_codon:yes gene_type:complete